jgi:hypothetical protein
MTEAKFVIRSICMSHKGQLCLGGGQQGCMSLNCGLTGESTCETVISSCSLVSCRGLSSLAVSVRFGVADANAESVQTVAR